MKKTASLVAFLLTTFCHDLRAHGQTLEWTRQLVTGSRDWGWDVSADGQGSVYISGWTEGDLVEGSSAGGRDGFVS